jgi:Aldehyde dehydrogenase family
MSGPEPAGFVLERQTSPARSVAWFYEIAKQSLPDEEIEDTPQRRAITRHTPLGVVGGITPRNVAILLAVWKKYVMRSAADTSSASPWSSAATTRRSCCPTSTPGASRPNCSGRRIAGHTGVGDLNPVIPDRRRRQPPGRPQDQPSRSGQLPARPARRPEVVTRRSHDRLLRSRCRGTATARRADGMDPVRRRGRRCGRSRRRHATPPSRRRRR